MSRKSSNLLPLDARFQGKNAPKRVWLTALPRTPSCNTGDLLIRKVEGVWRGRERQRGVMWGGEKWEKEYFPPLRQPKVVLDLATPEGCKAELI